LSLLLGASARTGTQTQCIGDRAHTVSYSFQGETLETVTDAKISVRPEPAINGYCAGPSGDQAFCIGANTEDCSTAASVLPVNDMFDCENCFAGATTDLFYDLEIGLLGNLKKVELGLQDTHIRGSLELRGHADAAVPLASGSIPLVDPSKSIKISFTVAGIIPVDIEISMPTSLDYDLDVHGALDATAGADLDFNLGDHFVSWTKADGWEVHNTSASVQVAPVLTLNGAGAAAGLGLSLRNSLQVELHKVMWYHLNTNPALPTTLGADVGSMQACLNSDVDVAINHEADLHFTLLGKEIELAHFGPEDLFGYHKDQLLHKCVDLPAVLV
jgi:hypothetical protein